MRGKEKKSFISSQKSENYDHGNSKKKKQTKKKKEKEEGEKSLLNTESRVDEEFIIVKKF